MSFTEDPGPCHVYVPNEVASGGTILSVHSQRDLNMNCHIWPLDSDLSFKATIFSYRCRQTNLSRWDELAISNWPPLELLSWTLHGELPASEIGVISKEGTAFDSWKRFLFCQTHSLLFSGAPWPVLKPLSFLSPFWLCFALCITLVHSLWPNGKLFSLLIVSGLARPLQDHTLLASHWFLTEMPLCAPFKLSVIQICTSDLY